MSSDVREKLAQALSKIDRPGTFCASGSCSPVLPGLEVKGLGPIGLPLSASQAEALKKQCEQAPYGKGEKTLVDTSVRRVWRLKPDRFSLRNTEWDGFLQETVKKVRDELGLEKRKLECHLHELLLYEPGSFFLPHRDGEKLDGMIATLVVVLPCWYEGGELVVRHEGQEQTINFGRAENSAFQTHFAAFYADCEHEVRPLKQGYRLCLVTTSPWCDPRNRSWPHVNPSTLTTLCHCCATGRLQGLPGTLDRLGVGLGRGRWGIWLRSRLLSSQ